MLIWNQDTSTFDLHYLDHWESPVQEIHSANMIDIFGGGQLDLFVNVDDDATIPRVRTYHYQTNQVSIINPIKDNLHSFILNQNFPNPFNSSTEIRFKLTKSAKISLTVYDITGKVAQILVNNQHYYPGEYRLFWNGKNQIGKEVSSGIYLYELKGKNFKDVKKMLYIR